MRSVLAAFLISMSFGVADAQDTQTENPSPMYTLVIARVPDVGKTNAYGDDVAKLVAKFGGEYLFRGAPFKIVEGGWYPDAYGLVTKWPDKATFDRFWQSEEYQQQVLPLREGTGIYDIVLFEPAGPMPNVD